MQELSSQWQGRDYLHEVWRKRTLGESVPFNTLLCQLGEPRWVPRIHQTATIAGREVQDIIIDADSRASIVASDMLPRNPEFTRYTWLAGFGANPKRYRSVSVPVVMDGRRLTAPMAVVPRETLRGNSALLGRNIPGLSVKQVLCPTPIDDHQQQS